MQKISFHDDERNTRNDCKRVNINVKKMPLEVSAFHTVNFTGCTLDTWLLSTVGSHCPKNENSVY